MTPEHDYQTPVIDFLASINVIMTSEGPDKVSPPWHTDGQATDKALSIFPRKKHIHGDRWTIMFSRRGDSLSVPRNGPLLLQWWDSYRDAELRWMANNRRFFMHLPSLSAQFLTQLSQHGFKQIKDIPKLSTLIPTPYDVLACITKSHPGTFENMCADFGYDTDSRKAFNTYQAVLDEYGKVARFFTSTELETLQEIAQ